MFSTIETNFATQFDSICVKWLSYSPPSGCANTAYVRIVRGVRVRFTGTVISYNGTMAIYIMY